MNFDKRDSSIDVVKIVALFGVISIHFFRYVGYYTLDIHGPKLIFATIARSFFMYCVPLFIIVTGYLMNQKKLTKKYYKGIRRTLLIYLFSSVVCILFTHFVLGIEVSKWGAILRVLGFKGAEYSWYIEMYIGLFLMIPFLNLIYNGLNSKKQKQILLLTGIVLTALPLVLNVYNLILPGWFSNPRSSDDFQKIIPDFWVDLYPVSYYFIGCYLAEFKIEMKQKTNALLLLVSILVAGVYNVYRSFGGPMHEGQFQYWGSLFNVIQATLLFMFLTSFDLTHLKINIKKTLKRLADITLGAYLVSYVFDLVVYDFFNAKVPLATDRLVFYLPVVMIIFFCSMCLSWILTSLAEKFA